MSSKNKLEQFLKTKKFKSFISDLFKFVYNSEYTYICLPILNEVEEEKIGLFLFMTGKNKEDLENLSNFIKKNLVYIDDRNKTE